MSARTYYAPQGGHPGQTELLTGRAVFTEAYAVIPKGVMRDIVTSSLPLLGATRGAGSSRGRSVGLRRDLLAIHHGGRSRAAAATGRSPTQAAEGVLFVVEGELTVDIGERSHVHAAGRLCLHAAGAAAGRRATTAPSAARLPLDPQGLRVRSTGSRRPSRWSPTNGDRSRSPMPDTEGRWATTRFVDPADLRHDMHVTIVTLEPGAVIPFAETHVMEHGLYVLEGKAVYRLNQDWVEVEAGDYMWLRAFCPQACYAGGPGRFRYLLYKDVNRHAKLGLFRR